MYQDESTKQYPGHGDEDLPEGVHRSREDRPEGQHYFYWKNEILIARDDLPLIADKLKVDERVKPDPPPTPMGDPRLGVVFVEATSDEDVPALVEHLRQPIEIGHSVQIPRVQPHLVLFPHYHGPYDPLGPAVPAAPIGNLPRRRFFPLPGHGVKVAVVDTGVWREHRPWFDGRTEGRVPQDEDVLDLDGDGMLNRADGHGTFIASVILKHAPGARVIAFRARATDPELTKVGMVLDVDLATAILDVAGTEIDIINVSAGGPTHEGGGLPCTIAAIESLLATKPTVAVVASAGNAGVPVPFFPAAMKGVISVGAVETKGGKDVRASYSNFGTTVDAAAPGTDVHATYVDFPPAFKGWAKWSGTSFSAPTVAAAVATRRSPGGWRQYLWFLRPKSARQAAYQLISDPSLPRVPGIGTIVRPKTYC
ncbi:MAG: S8/S53 family peptidase [Actinomycetota bacterium]|nr:S8/S53 family peptidase [Actinomycetota bacterium]